jgi:hypothetical protein
LIVESYRKLTWKYAKENTSLWTNGKKAIAGGAGVIAWSLVQFMWEGIGQSLGLGQTIPSWLTSGLVALPVSVVTYVLLYGGQFVLSLFWKAPAALYQQQEQKCEADKEQLRATEREAERAMERARQQEKETERLEARRTERRNQIAGWRHMVTGVHAYCKELSMMGGCYSDALVRNHLATHRLYPSLRALDTNTGPTAVLVRTNDAMDGMSATLQHLNALIDSLETQWGLHD